MNILYFCITIALFYNRFSTTSAEIDSKHNVFCEAIAKVVPVEQDGLPYYVTLNRCQGSILGHNPTKKECVELTSDTVVVNVTNEYGQSKLISMKNHTKCTGKCLFDDDTCSTAFFHRNNEDCSCTCKYLTSAPPGVKIDTSIQRWNAKSCSVQCLLRNEDRPPSKRLDKEKCQFVCKATTCNTPGFYVEPEKCHCVKNQNVTTNTGASTSKKAEDCDVFLTTVIVAVVEFCILFFIFECYMYRHRAGLTYYMRETCLKSRDKVQNKGTCDKNSSDASDTPLTVHVDRNGTTKTTSNNCQNVSAI